MPSTPQPMICGRQGDDAGQASEESAPTLISPLPSRPNLDGVAAERLARRVLVHARLVRQEVLRWQGHLGGWERGGDPRGADPLTWYTVKAAVTGPRAWISAWICATLEGTL